MILIHFFTSPLALEILGKLLIAFLLSLVIGLEREWIHKPAGVKTHTLICISAALVMALGIYLYDKYPHIDPARLPAQVLAGIGFVGAGTIIRDGFSVKGITTAASLLAITCIGLAVGAGFYEGAVYATFIIFLILSFTVPFQKLIDKNRKTILFTITAQSVPKLLGRVEEIFDAHGVKILNVKEHEDPVSQYTLLKIFAKCSNVSTRESLIQRLCELDCVKEIYTSKKTYHHDTE